MAVVGDIGRELLRERRAGIEERGDQLLFYLRALAWTPRAVTRYRREVLNTLAEVAFGTGGLSVIAGTVGVIAFMAFFAGTEVGIQGYAWEQCLWDYRFSLLTNIFQSVFQGDLRWFRRTLDVVQAWKATELLRPPAGSA